MVIRAYRTEDEQQAEQICLGTSADPKMDHSMFREAVLEVFCRYYLQNTPEHCFVAVDEHNKVQGYILCAPDFAVYESGIRQKISRFPQNPVIPIMTEGTLSAMRPFSEEYPAHLHIDLAPSCQGKGIGRELVHTLCNHLRNLHAPGLMLNVAHDNTGAIRFYEKLGFTQLSENEAECAYGMKL